MPLRHWIACLVLISSTPGPVFCSSLTKSLYVGGSWGHDLDVYSDANFSAQVGLFRVPPDPGWALGGEIGVLGLGSMGFAHADDTSLLGGNGPTHYGSAFAGLGLRRMIDGGDRVRSYIGAGTAVHLVRTPGIFATDDPPIWVRPGISMSAGIYGLAPGYLGIEARAHAVAAGKGEGVGGPLFIYSIMAGINAR